MPACNFGSGIEWQVGFASAREGGAMHFSEAYAQAKVARGDIEAMGWSWGLVLGVSRFPKRGVRSGWSDPFATVPVSVPIGESHVHLSAGWARDRAQRRSRTTWGAAIEMPASERTTLVAEAFGANRERPFLRAGARFNVIKDIFDVDVTAVARPGGARDERFISLGVFWQSGRFLP